MRMSRGRLAVTAALCCVLAACGSEASTETVEGVDTQPDDAAQVEQAATFTEREVSVYRETPTDETVTLRFYEATPDVAYVSVADYYTLMLPQASMDVEKAEDGTYLLTSHTGASEDTAMELGLGGTATVDVVADTLTSPDLPAFTNTMSFMQEGMDNIYSDAVPYVRVAGATYDKEPDVVTLDFGKYGIAVYGDDEGVYLPFQTLSVIYTDFANNYATFNGETVYVNHDNFYDDVSTRDPSYSDPILSVTERPQDMVDFGYSQLCFTLEYFYGCPARFEYRDVFEQQGLDGMLESIGEEGTRTKEGLLSQDLATYMAAIDDLSRLFNDGGHTVIDYSSKTDLASDEKHADLLASYTEKTLGYHPDLIEKAKVGVARKQQRDDAYGKDVTYVSKGDTAVIVLDSFVGVDFEGWADYYAGTGERPTSDKLITNGFSNGMADSAAIVYEGLERAEADPQIKNVVLDISNNTGGSLDTLMFIAKLISGRDSMQFNNIRTNQIVTETYEIDTNLDKVFDEKDKEQPYTDLNIAVLTSQTSFSCGNLLPALLKDDGIPIIGEQSGGGSCAVQWNVLADGVPYGASSWRGRLINAAGEEIDWGVPVEVDLLELSGAQMTTVDVILSDEGTTASLEAMDYSSFYDLDLLNQVMHDLFADGATDAVA